MKLTAILIIAFLQLPARPLSQTVTLSVKATSLQKVISSIEKQTGYVFFYDGSVLKNAKPVTANILNVSLETALHDVFIDQPVGYTIKEKTINLFKKAERPQQKEVITIIEQPAALPPLPPTVHGRIINEKGEPVAGVNISIKGGKVIGQTDSNGEFTLTNVPDAAVLVFTAVNLETYETKLNGRTELALSVKTKVSALDEIQVIAYGSVSKRLNTGNVSIIRAEDIEKSPVTNPILALQARVPGIFINQVNGISNGAVGTLVQGRNSLQRNNDPLYVIDGVPYISQLVGSFGGILGNSSNGNPSFGSSPLAFINPADIESISVLKDADATAIYGSRAGNGAILITTKKGKGGQTRFDVDAQNGWGKDTRRLSLVNSQQYLSLRREAFNNDNAIPTFANGYDLLLFDTTRYTDWQETLIGGTAQYTNINATVSGGNRNLQFRVGGTYNRQTTVFPGDFSDKKGSVHFNINSISDNQKFKVRISGMYLSDNNQLPNSDLTARSILISPVSPALYNVDGTLNWATDPSGTSRFTNPLATLNNSYGNKTTNLISSMELSYQILKKFELSATFGYNNLQANELVTTPLTSTAPENRPTTNRIASYSNKNINSWSIEPQLSYHQIYRGIKMEFLLGSSIQKINTSNTELTGTGFNSDAVMADIKSASTITVNSTTKSVYRYNAGFARLNFNLDDKYLLNLSARRDGSSRFGPESRFHNFGAVGAGWIFSQEDWVKKKIKFLNFGKLRASYGTTGNDNIGDYQFLDQYAALAGIGVPYQGAIGYAPTGLPNAYLQWEDTRKLSIGMDLGFLNERVIAGITYFQNRSSNQLVSYALPSLAGFANVAQNSPALVQNNGWEFSLNTTNFKSKEFQWTTAFNLTLPYNKLLAFPNIAQTSLNSSLVVGAPFTLAKVFHFLGVNPATGQFTFADAFGNATLTPNFTFDRTVLINTSPRFYGGLSNTISYKNFTVDFLVQFTKRMGVGYSFGPNNPGFQNFNIPVDVYLNHWQKPGDVSPNAKFSASGNSQFTNAATQSDAGYVDASYIRLKNVTLSWSLPDKWKTKAHLREASLYVHTQNLLTITNYNGLDPESMGTSALPPLRVITIGFHVGL